MNQKASVSKELNARHSKILEGLLKLPENRECADCQNRGPRWASVNLGIFLCMQCSGVHRSLGVHISQVRSITLDTWLPEQVAFMQSMGNEKSNKYWEGEPPPEGSRRKIETFIRAKYDEKRWVREGATKPIPIPADTININKFVESEAKNGVPRRTRNFSLEEKILTQRIAQITPPPVRSHKGSLDMNGEILGSTLPKLSPVTTEFNTPRKKTNTATDLYSKIYTSNGSQDHSSETPSRWATFECESHKLHNDFLWYQLSYRSTSTLRPPYSSLIKK